MQYNRETIDSVLKLRSVADPYSDILEICKENSSRLGKYMDKYEMLFRIISCLGKESFNDFLETVIGDLQHGTIDCLFEALSKGLRQWDVFDNGDLDMLFRCMLFESKIPKIVFMEVFVDGKNRRVHDDFKKRFVGDLKEEHLSNRVWGSQKAKDCVLKDYNNIHFDYVKMLLSEANKISFPAYKISEKIRKKFGIELFPLILSSGQVGMLKKPKPNGNHFYMASSEGVYYTLIGSPTHYFKHGITINIENLNISINER